MTKRHAYDVVILGGGPAGAATALSLKLTAPSLSVAIVERGVGQRPRIGETLPPNIQPVLEQLGVWKDFLAAGHLPAYGTSSAWGGSELYENEFIYSPYGRGWRLDRQRFDAMLSREAEVRGVDLYGSHTVSPHARRAGGRWQLMIEGPAGESLLLEPRLIVDATGRSASFASRQGARKIFFDRLVGAFMTFRSSTGNPSANTYTLVESFEDGWWYSGVLPCDQIVVSCMTDSDIAKRRNLKSQSLQSSQSPQSSLSPLSSLSSWMGLVETTRYTRARIAGAVPDGPPSIRAAYSHRLDRVTGDGWIAVGDAASCFDPLSSQGIMKALRSGILASYAVHDSFHGLSSGLEKYSRIVEQEFDSYLDTRSEFHRQERRWPTSPFWKRRHQRISLDPMELLCGTGNNPRTAAWRSARAYKSIPTGLPDEDIEFMLSICGTPRRAHELVSEFRDRSPRPMPDQRIIQAIQSLIEQGLIEQRAVANNASGQNVHEAGATR